MASNTNVAYPGSYLSDLQITCDMLLDPNSILNNTSSRKNISNGAVWEIRKILESDYAALDALKAINCSFKECNQDSLRRKISLTYNNIKKMRKTGTKKKEIEYSKKDFVAPIPLVELQVESLGDCVSEKDKAKIKEVKERTKEVIKENRGLKREVQDKMEDIIDLSNYIISLEEKLGSTLGVMNKIQTKYKETLEKFRNDKSELRKESEEWEKKFEMLSCSFDKLTDDHDQAKQKLSTYNIRNTNKRQKRMKEKLEKEVEKNSVLNVQVSDLQNELKETTENLDVSQSKLLQMREEKRNLQKRVSKLKRERLSERNRKSEVVLMNELEIERLKSEIDQHRDRIAELEEVNGLLESESVKTFEDGRYVNEVRECIMTLLTECNVSLNKVNKVICTVLSNLTGKLPERLPSMAVRSRLYIEAKAVSHQQIVQAMLADSNPSQLVGNTLHSDATSKFFKHYQSFQITTSQGSALSIGLSELGGSDSVSVMESFKSLIEDLAESVSSSEEDTSRKIKELVCSITSTMSDQGAINPVFNRMLSDMRSVVLPSIIEGWDTLDTGSKEQLMTMGNFFCKMHLVVNFASESDKCLKEFENNIIESGKNPHSFGNMESSAVRLIRTSAKAFTSHGSEKAGVASHWESYLDEKGKSNHLVTFRSNRFNIIYFNAAALYYHWEDVQDFLNQWLSPNDLLKSIAFDVNEKLTKAGVRALGIIDKLVTGPMWRLFEKEGSILSLNPYLKHVLEKFQEWGSNSGPMLEGQELFHDIDVHKDEMYEALFKDTDDPELDSLTQMALELTINAMLLILDRQAKDQLPGGKYCNPSPELPRQAAAVPKTNTISERDFGSLDLLVRMKPGASSVCYESIVLWSNNKTAAWLDNLGEEERNHMLNIARKRAPELRGKFQERKKSIKEQKLKILKEKQSKKQAKDENQRVNKIKLTNEITSLGGVWPDVDTLKAKVETLSTSQSDLYKALITQIKFHKDVLNSRGPREIFQKSKAKHVFTTEELASNLQKILELNSTPAPNQNQNLVLKDIDQVKVQLDNAKLAMTNKIKQSRQKRCIAQQKDLLPKFLAEPNELVGKKVMHQCFANDGTSTEWYPAKVKKVQKEFPSDTIKTKYVVVYDEVPSDEYVFDLLRDLKKGDLIIID